MNVGGRLPQQIKPVMTKEDLPWRTFVDPAEQGFGPIAKKWNLTGTPTMYVLDQEGIIRRKWIGAPGAEALEEALAPLIEAASGK